MASGLAKGSTHYTDLGGMQGIVSKSDLWLTSARYSNDSEEMTHGHNVARRVIAAQREASERAPNPNRTAYLDAIAARLATEPTEGVYICCFCLTDNLLSQWRGYGGNGSGVSIEFEPHSFDVITGADSPHRGLMRLWKVFYDPAVQEDIVSQAIDFVFLMPLPDDVRAKHAADAITFFIPTFKNNDFREEQECRLIFTPPPACPTRQSFRVARGMLIPYYSLQDLTIGSNLRLPIKRVLVGPTPHKALNVSSAEALLASAGYDDVPVVASTTPFRA
jgi:hypothetical protein